MSLIQVLKSQYCNQCLNCQRSSNDCSFRVFFNLRHCIQYWQLRTWIYNNLCYLTISCFKNVIKIFGSDHNTRTDYEESLPENILKKNLGALCVLSPGFLKGFLELHDYDHNYHNFGFLNNGTNKQMQHFIWQINHNHIVRCVLKLFLSQEPYILYIFSSSCSHQNFRIQSSPIP